MDIAGLALDPSSTVSLYEQVIAGIMERIHDGLLQTGARLPSERDLAEQLGVSRTTAINAYSELEARGIIRRQVGRGTVICATSQSSDTPFAWRGKMARGAERVLDPGMRSLVAAPEPGTVSFAAGVPALDCFPMDLFRRLTDDVLRGGADRSLGLAPTEGQPALRTSLADRFHVGPDQVLVVSGAQQGLDLIARCLLDPGDSVVMDRPGYLGAIQTFRAAGARIVGWDVARDDLDELEDLLLRHRPKFLYTTPTFQNPTGRTRSLTTRRDLLRLATRYRLPIVEDDPYRDLYFKHPPPPSLVQLDDHNLVIHLGTFSKTFAAGLRLGWLVAATPIVEQLAVIKGRSDMFSPGPNQLVLAEMLRSRLFDAHLTVLRQEHERRHDAMTAALKRAIPAGALTWHLADGGLYLWCEVRRDVDVQQLHRQALWNGVSFVPGESFYSDGGGRHELRLCFTSASTTAIEEGVGRLAALFKVARRSVVHSGDGTHPLP